MLGLRITDSWRLLGTGSCSGSAWAAWLRGSGLKTASQNSVMPIAEQRAAQDVGREVPAEQHPVEPDDHDLKDATA